MKCAVYVRTNNEATNTKSIQYQISFLENYINNHELELYKTYSDISDGSTLERDGIRELMEDAKEKKFDAILVKDLTRISRNNAFLSEFKDVMIANQIDFIILDETKKTLTKITPKILVRFIREITVKADNLEVHHRNSKSSAFYV